MWKFDKHVKMNVMSGLFGGGGDSSDASRDAANVAAQSEKDKLAYLKEVNALPQEIRDQMLPQLAEYYGAAPEDNPMYQAQLGQINNMQQNQTNAMQAASGAGGTMRGGNYMGNIAGISQTADMAQQQALANSYNQKIQGMGSLAGMDTGTNQIANTMGNIGNIQAQGIMGAAQSQQAGNQAGFGNMMGLANMGMQAYSMFSDKRLKDSLTKVEGTKDHRINKYTWTWNDKAEKLGLHGDDYGYLAQEVEGVYPEFVSVHPSGYKRIDTRALERKLGVGNV